MVASAHDVTAIISIVMGVIVLVWHQPIARASCAIQRAVVGSTHDPEKDKWVWVVIAVALLLAGIGELLGLLQRQ
jgi:hypothetical protein